MTSAAQVMDEINDFLDVLDTKLTRLGKNLDRLESGAKNTAEIKKLRETCEKEAERISNDIKTLNYDLKRLPKD
jgi:archaellum component FlaC